MLPLRFRFFTQSSRLVGAVLFLLILNKPEIFAASRKVAVVDSETNTLSPAEKSAYLQILRNRLTAQGLLTVMSADEVQAGIRETNQKQDDVDRLRSEHDRKKAEIQAQIGEAQKAYLESRFDEALATLKTAWVNLDDAALALTPDIPLEILQLRAVCLFFLGQEVDAKADLRAALDLDPQFSVSAERFPPPFVELFQGVKSEPPVAPKDLAGDASQTDFRIRFLGREMTPQFQGARFTLPLPMANSVLGDAMVVFEKTGFRPVLLKLNEVKSPLNFESLESKEHSTRGLFGPVIRGTPPTELKWFVDQLKADILFLGTVDREAPPAVGWRVTGQWLEGSTGRTSRIETGTSPEVPAAIDQMLSALAPSLGPQGGVIPAPFLPKGVETETATVGVIKPFYQQWWFWTAVGVVTVGAGVGTYLALKPEDKLRFGAQRAN